MTCSHARKNPECQQKREAECPDKEEKIDFRKVDWDLIDELY
jgi:hypothetical protein